MKAQINRHLLNQTRFDSGALTSAGFVVHPYHKPGRYQADVSRNGQHHYSFYILVTPDSSEMQISVDLAALNDKLKSPAGDCGCGHSEHSMQLAPGGYGLFYSAADSGAYSLKTFPITATEKDRDQVFDSTALQADDMFGITLLRPGYYAMRDIKQNLQCRLQVDPVLPGKERYTPPDAIHLEAKDLKSAKNDIRLMQAQGLVYRSHADARIVIELEKPIEVEESGAFSSTSAPKVKPKTKTAKRKPVASWKKPGIKR